MTDQDFLEAMCKLRLRYQQQIVPFAERALKRAALLHALGDLIAEDDLRKIDQIVSMYRDTPNTEAYWSEARSLVQNFLTSQE
jgi:hypothetical protein